MGGGRGNGRRFNMEDFDPGNFDPENPDSEHSDTDNIPFNDHRSNSEAPHPVFSGTEPDSDPETAQDNDQDTAMPRSLRQGQISNPCPTMAVLPTACQATERFPDSTVLPEKE